VAKAKTQFVCSNCGYSTPRYLGRCPNCGEWNTLAEEHFDNKPDRKSRVSFAGKAAMPQRLKEVTMSKTPRGKTKLREFNRVLGGGVVPGSLVLIGGDPGIGKSTLLLQVSGQLAETGGSVLYVTGEESASQVKMRADRLKVESEDFYLYPETDMSNIRATIESIIFSQFFIHRLNSPRLTQALCLTLLFFRLLFFRFPPRSTGRVPQLDQLSHPA